MPTTPAPSRHDHCDFLHHVDPDHRSNAQCPPHADRHPSGHPLTGLLPTRQALRAPPAPSPPTLRGRLRRPGVAHQSDPHRAWAGAQPPPPHGKARACRRLRAATRPDPPPPRKTRRGPPEPPPQSVNRVVRDHHPPDWPPWRRPSLRRDRRPLRLPPPVRWAPRRVTGRRQRRTLPAVLVAGWALLRARPWLRPTRRRPSAPPSLSSDRRLHCPTTRGACPQCQPPPQRAGGARPPRGQRISSTCLTAASGCGPATPRPPRRPVAGPPPAASQSCAGYSSHHRARNL